MQPTVSRRNVKMTPPPPPPWGVGGLQGGRKVRVLPCCPRSANQVCTKCGLEVTVL